MEKVTKKLKCCDTQYALLNKILIETRKNYQYGKMDLSYLNAFEEYLYPEHFQRRDIFDELNRIASYSKNLYGKTDTEFLNSYIPNTYRNMLDNKMNSIRGRNHSINRGLYSKNNVFELLSECMHRFEPKIAELLDSKFIITKVEHITTFPKSFDKSGSWHFDPVPIGYGKLFILLSDSDTTDGKTEYMSPLSSLELINQS